MSLHNITFTPNRDEGKYYFHSIGLNIRFLDGKIDEICVW